MAEDRNWGPQRALPTAFSGHGPTPFPPIMASVQSLYEAAQNRAIHDCQLDRLFNPDFYAAQEEQ